MSKDDYSSEICLIAKVENFSQFFDLYSNLKRPSVLNNTMLVFRKNYYPSWESNPNGGMYYLTIKPKDVDLIWEFVLFKFLLQTEKLFKLNVTTEIIGLVIKQRNMAYQLEFWTNKFNLFSVKDISTKIKTLLNFGEEDMLHSTKFKSKLISN